jgi:hypothetical protein
LTFGSNGTLSGTPTSTGSFPITVNVKDSLDQDATQDFTITIYDHGFEGTGKMVNARSSHTATMLESGMVLVAGGITTAGYTGNATKTTDACELYDPATGTFSATGNMSIPRVGHTATKLSNGKVLITGGPDTTSGLATGSAELYDPSAGTFGSTSDMNEKRFAHTATLLKDGKVLIVGGNHRDSTELASAELYDPESRTFTLTGSLRQGRSAHTATLLSDGRVLIAGGAGVDPATGNAVVLDTTEIYDPGAGAFTLTNSNMKEGRASHTATLLGDGKVLLAGGGRTVVSTELFDPATGVFSSAGDMSAARESHAAVLLGDGKVLVSGGRFTSIAIHGCCAAGSAEVFDTASRNFVGTGSMTAARFSHTATLLNNGKVLVTGGIGASGHPLDSAEIYQ